MDEAATAPAIVRQGEAEDIVRPQTRGNFVRSRSGFPVISCLTPASPALGNAERCPCCLGTSALYLYPPFYLRLRGADLAKIGHHVVGHQLAATRIDDHFAARQRGVTIAASENIVVGG